ncbi:hypothetical protein CORC01_04855 [Colletotrichum orchidophilum]|uniref:Uncharacterized protein n=1 Tax=Colletotrichum orchidophilum TaxID=1209926 RepID=A0A1G4BET5_9PEZI|nr:uncharacterized protein CORC01_04855 [Colletotrichum orchidophilum]OHE99954.1 hypothetical protein CORC01_04855 [Colletotrichum orchidophilum]
MDLFFAKNDFQFEPSAWFTLAELNSPNLRRRRLRAPLRLQELWTELIARMRRISVNLMWDEAYLTAVSSALIQNAHTVTELTFFLPDARRRAGKMKMGLYGDFLRDIARIPTLKRIKLGSQTPGGEDILYFPRKKWVAGLTGALVDFASAAAAG